MSARVESIWFFVIFIPITYLCYVLLMCFDFAKVLRRNKVRDLRMLMILVSVGISYLFTEAFLAVINHFAVFL